VEINTLDTPYQVWRTIHPHVSGSSICWGNVSHRANEYKSEGRIGDFLSLLDTVLTTYNGGNPYTTLQYYVKNKHNRLIKSNYFNSLSNKAFIYETALKNGVHESIRKDVENLLNKERVNNAYTIGKRDKLKLIVNRDARIKAREVLDEYKTHLLNTTPLLEPVEVEEYRYIPVNLRELRRVMKERGVVFPDITGEENIIDAGFAATTYGGLYRLFYYFEYDGKCFQFDSSHTKDTPLALYYDRIDYSFMVNKQYHLSAIMLAKISKPESEKVEVIGIDDIPF
jgi:hypothetical protein